MSQLITKIEELFPKEKEMLSKIDPSPINLAYKNYNQGVKDSKQTLPQILALIREEIEKIERYDFGGYPDDRYMESEIDGEYIKYDNIINLLK